MKVENGNVDFVFLEERERSFDARCSYHRAHPGERSLYRAKDQRLIVHGEDDNRIQSTSCIVL